MKTFTIDQQDHISTFAEGGNDRGLEHCTSLEELTELAAGWPAARLAAIWNALPGMTPLKKFTDRPTAVARI